MSRVRVFHRVIVSLAIVLFAVPALAGILETSPYAWYRADVGVTSSGGVVSAWADQSGHARNLESQGTVTVSPLGYLETDSGIMWASDSSSSWGNAAKGTVFAVWSANATLPGSSFIYATVGPASPDQHMGNEDPGSNQGSSYGDVAGWGVGKSIGPGSGPGPYNMPREDGDHLKVSYATYIGGSDALEIWNVEDSSLLVNMTGNCESGGMDGICIGGIRNSSNGNMYHNWEGVIAEVVVYEGSLTSTQIDAVRSELIGRWSPTPEPSTMLLLVTGLLGLLAYAWRKRR